MERPRLQICYHDHCFDGVASAATFLRFWRDKVAPLDDAEVRFRGLAHRAGQLFGEEVFASVRSASVSIAYAASRNSACRNAYSVSPAK